MRLLVLTFALLSGCTLGIPAPTCAPTEHETPSGECIWLDPRFDDGIQATSFDMYDELFTAMDLPEGYLLVVVRDGDTVTNMYETHTGFELPKDACVNGFNTDDHAVAIKSTVVHELMHVELLHQGAARPGVEGDTWLSDSFEKAHSAEYGWTDEVKARERELNSKFDVPLSASLCTL